MKLGTALFVFAWIGFAATIPLLEQQISITITPGEYLSIPWSLPGYGDDGPTWDENTQNVLSLPSSLLNQAIQGSVRTASSVCDGEYVISMLLDDVCCGGATNVASNTSLPIVCGLYRNNVILDSITFNPPFDDTNSQETRCVYPSAGMQCTLDSLTTATFDRGDQLVAACRNGAGFTVIDLSLCNDVTVVNDAEGRKYFMDWV